MIAGALAALLDLEATSQLKAVWLLATFLVAGKQILNKARGRMYFGSQFEGTYSLPWWEELDGV